MTNAEKVLEFHKTFGMAVDEEFDPGLNTLRIKLLREEAQEAIDELLEENPSRQKVAKELADVLYVTYGAAVSFGIDIDWVFNEIHKSNMSKLGLDGKPIYREDGKVLKGPNYKEPNLQLNLNL